MAFKKAPLIVFGIFILWIVCISWSISLQRKNTPTTMSKDKTIDSLQRRIHELESRPMFITFYVDSIKN